MKKLLLASLVLLGLNVSAQDTTSSRYLVSGTFPADLYFNPTDSAAVFATTQIDSAGFGSSSHALFVHPNNNRLYIALDTSGNSGRNLYEVNPLTGTKKLVYQFLETYSSLEITTDGRIFAIEGNAGSSQGAVHEIDPFNGTDSIVFQSSVPAFEPRALAYNSISDELYVISGFIDTIFVYNMNTWSESFVQASMGEEIHGAYFVAEDTALITVSYGGHVGNAELNTGFDMDFMFDVYPHSMDVTEVKLIDAVDGDVICSGNALSALYSSNAYAWYKDSVMIPNSDTMHLEVSESGTYQLVTQIGDSAYIWSESVSITVQNSPVVSIMPGDTVLCAGDTIMLTGSFGGASQWFMNGDSIAGADSNVYMATMAGTYNMIKVNQNGCADSADVGVTIDTLSADSCEKLLNVESPAMADLNIYPNPVNGVLNITANAPIMDIRVFDLQGKVLMHINGRTAARIELDLQVLDAGMYLIEVQSSTETHVERVLKL